MVVGVHICQNKSNCFSKTYNVKRLRKRYFLYEYLLRCIKIESNCHITYIHNILVDFITFCFKFFCQNHLSERDHEKNIFPFPLKKIYYFYFENLENFCGSYSITFKKDLYPSGYSNSRYFCLCIKT